MKNTIKTKSQVPGFLLLCFLLVPVLGFTQEKSIPDFLKEKQVWEEKLVVVYAPAEQQSSMSDQLNALYSSMEVFKKQKIVVVQIPAALSYSNRQYLKKNLRYHEDRLNVWVLDEKGMLRMSSTKIVAASQLLKVLNVENRPQGMAQVQYLWNK